MEAMMLGGPDDGKVVAWDRPDLQIARLVGHPPALATESEPDPRTLGYEVEEWRLVDYVRPIEVGKLHGRIGRFWVQRGGPFDPRQHDARPH